MRALKLTPFVNMAKARIQVPLACVFVQPMVHRRKFYWIPAFAGMTREFGFYS